MTDTDTNAAAVASVDKPSELSAAAGISPDAAPAPAPAPAPTEHEGFVQEVKDLLKKLEDMVFKRHGNSPVLQSVQVNSATILRHVGFAPATSAISNLPVDSTAGTGSTASPAASAPARPDAVPVAGVETMSDNGAGGSSKPE